MTTFDEWFSKQEGPAWHELELRWGRHIAKVAWDASRASVETPTEIPSQQSYQQGYYQGRADMGDIHSPAYVEPTLTRADILRWPASEEGRRRLREECAKIVDKGNVTMLGLPVVASWQPDRDANQCKMVMDALAKDRWQWDIGNTGEQCYAALWHRGKGEVKVGYDELPDADWLVKVCVAACIAKLARAT